MEVPSIADFSFFFVLFCSIIFSEVQQEHKIEKIDKKIHNTQCVLGVNK